MSECWNAQEIGRWDKLQNVIQFARTLPKKYPILLVPQHHQNWRMWLFVRGKYHHRFITTRIAKEVMDDSHYCIIPYENNYYSLVEIEKVS